MNNPIPLGRIASLSAVHNLADLHEQWFKLRQANPSGVASIGNRAAAGNEIFWTESTKVKGLVFLWCSERVLTALEAKAVCDPVEPCLAQQVA